VSTYQKSIDFLNDQDDLLKSSQKSLGEQLLNNLEVFRKTYICLSTHMNECADHLQKLFTKYVNKYLSSFKSKKLDSYHYDPLLVAIACENSIVGYVFLKVWPCIVEANQEKDYQINSKCLKIYRHLMLHKIMDGNSIRTEEREATLVACSLFFQIDRSYFSINFGPILRELNKSTLHNNPFERLQCFKTTIDLLTNELTLSVNKNDNQSDAGPITGDILVPLVAFLFINGSNMKSSDGGMDNLMSNINFIELFHFCGRQTDNHNDSYVNSSLILELNFLFTTIRASIELIQQIDLSI
jgi:hypothetical protein